MSYKLVDVMVVLKAMVDFFREIDDLGLGAAASEKA
jgi:hypothetical protein